MGSNEFSMAATKLMPLAGNELLPEEAYIWYVMNAFLFVYAVAVGETEAIFELPPPYTYDIHLMMRWHKRG